MWKTLDSAAFVPELVPVSIAGLWRGKLVGGGGAGSVPVHREMKSAGDRGRSSLPSPWEYVCSGWR